MSIIDKLNTLSQSENDELRGIIMEINHILDGHSPKMRRMVHETFLCAKEILEEVKKLERKIEHD